MRFATNRVPVLARILPYTLALGCAALLGLPASASAGTILQFSQQAGSADFVEFSANTGTLTTHGVLPSNLVSIPITISQIGIVSLPPALSRAAFETFVGVTSSEPQSGNQKGGFSGTIEITSGPNGSGTNLLTGRFSGGILSAIGNAGSFIVPENVTFTTQSLDIITALGGLTTFTGSLDIGLSVPSPPNLPQSVPFTDFRAQNQGGFNAIPEPASVVMMGLGVVGVLGYASLRHKSSKA